MCTRSNSIPHWQEGNSVHIDYVEITNISVDYEITVPTDTTVRTHTGSGDQTIEGTHGSAELQTGSGDVKLTNLTGDVRLQTGSGDVRARGISGAVKGGTGSGDVEVEETGPGDIDLHTGSGKLSRAGSEWFPRRSRQRRHYRGRHAEQRVGNSYRLGQRACARPGKRRV